MKDTKANTKKATVPKVKNTKLLANNFFILKLTWKICPARVIADFSMSAINYFSWVFYSIVFIKYLLSAVEAHKSFNSVLLFVIATMVVFAILDLYGRWYTSRTKPITDNIINTKLNEMLFEKAGDVELACYEDTDFYNTYTLAIKEADTRVTSVLNNITGIIFAVIAAFCVFLAMFRIDKFVILFVISPMVGNFVFGKMMNKIIYNRDVDSVPHQRKMNYVNRVVYLQNFSKEIRLSRIFNVLKHTYENGYSGVIDVINKYKKKSTTVNFFQDITTFLIIFEGVLLYGSFRAIISKTITLSEFAVLASAMTSATWILIGLSKNIMNTLQNGLYIENLKKFLSYESQISENQDGIIPQKKIDMIEFKNVGFTYKGSNSPVIKDINMKIKGGEKIALVGHNGAGKTTLVKLLMRLYDPTEGEITINNVNIKNYNVQKFRNLFGAAFQDYQIFSMTIAENVLMREPENSYDFELAKGALKKSGIYEKVMSMKNNVNTVLTREFDNEGVILSGGETQKIAVSRAFAKDFEIAVFDEPSSALDPIAEYRLYESIMDSCKDKTVFFISHRLSSAILADRVYMLEDGTVVEEGTHKELMAMRGKYAAMFTKQAERYVEDNYSFL